jgi:hypothetical protein
MSGVCWSAAIAVAVEPANVSNKRNAKGCLNVFIMVLRCFNTEMLSHSTAKLEAFQARIPELRMTFWPYTKELPDGFRANCVNICEYNWIYNIYTYIYIRSSTHIEYGIEILVSPGIPGIELEKRYLEYSWRQKTYTQNIVGPYHTISILSLVQTKSSFFSIEFPHFSL